MREADAQRAVLHDFGQRELGWVDRVAEVGGYVEVAADEVQVWC